MGVLHGSDVELHVGGADQQERCAEYLRHHHKGVRVDVELHVGGADQQVRCAEYLDHHHEGARVEMELWMS